MSLFPFRGSLSGSVIESRQALTRSISRALSLNPLTQKTVFVVYMYRGLLAAYEKARLRAKSDYTTWNR